MKRSMDVTVSRKRHCLSVTHNLTVTLHIFNSLSLTQTTKIPSSLDVIPEWQTLMANPFPLSS